MEKILRVLKIEIEKALKENEVPIASVITLNGEIIASAHNTVIRKKSPLNHAEINCITKANKSLQSWNLNKCILYTTVKPCKMCEEIIKNARIKKVYYLLDNKKIVNNNIEYVEIKNNNLKLYLKEKLTNFFKYLR